MSNINILPDIVIDQIAAGEIIERPASIVKELVENSLDARAKNITVDITNGGKQSIIITDDGHGMEQNDLKECIKRFATSKINAFEDLDKIHSYGFRGEALPSICSVSRTTITSKTDKNDSAYFISTENGKTIKEGPAVLKTGTRIMIEDLFYNTPARLKFLKKDQTEFRKIQTFIENISLTQPHLSLTLIHNNKTVFKVNSQKTLQERISEIYDNEIIKNICPIDYQFPFGHIQGFLSTPHFSRKDRTGIKIFINQRIVNNSTIQFSLNKFYKDKLHHGSFPFAIILLNIEPHLIDVNVHPAKHEIRFRSEGDIVSVCLKAFSIAFSRKVNETYSFNQPNDSQTQNDSIKVPSSIEDLKQSQFEYKINHHCNHKTINDSQPIDYSKNNSIPNSHQDVATNEKNSITEEITPTPSVKLIGQALNRYLIAEKSDKLLIIDQHASHERILYEKAMHNEDHHSIESQQLLIPYIKTLLPQDFSVIEDFLDAFNKTGFQIEIFGKNTIKIESVPASLININFEELIEQVIIYFKDSSRGKPGLDKMIRGICRQSVMFGDHLHVNEQQSIIAQLFQCENPYSCPHGRPTFFELDSHEINRKLGR